jgi:hypothetical protein
MLTSGTFWLGILVGAFLYHAWRMYQARQSA